MVGERLLFTSTEELLGVDWLAAEGQGQAESRKRKIALTISRRTVNGRHERRSSDRFKKVAACIRIGIVC
jgi:hypothetical protein